MSTEPNVPAPSLGNLHFIQGEAITLDSIKSNNQILLLENWATW